MSKIIINHKQAYILWVLKFEYLADMFGDERINADDNHFFTIRDLAIYLNIKPKTIYSKIKEIPHYKIGRLIRFKRSDIDLWIEQHRQEMNKGSEDQCVKKALKAARKDNALNTDKLVKKIIDEVKGEKYTPRHGKSDQIKGLGKEVKDGII